MRESRTGLWALLMLSTCSGAAVAAAADAPARVILDTKALWRARIVWETDEVILPDGTVDHVYLKANRSAIAVWRKQPTVTEFTPVRRKLIRLPAHTSPGWMKPDFDDSTWVRCRAPFLVSDPGGRKGGWGSSNAQWALLLVRGRFEVTDPARAQGLTLSLVFRGGAVAYLNGEEIARSHMPKGKTTLYTNAEPYPEEAYLLPRGQLISTFDHRIKGVTERMRGRFRRLTGFRIPVSKLRKGVNVLAVAIHRPAAHWKYYATRVRPYAYGVYDSRAAARWSRIGLWQIQLHAPADAAVVPNVSRPPGRGLLAWNHSTVRRVHAADYADPHETLRPVRITGVRNGTFAGQIVVGRAEPITGLQVAVSDLRGPQTIPGSAVQVRYGRPDGRTRVYRGTLPQWFDSLDEVPPARVPALQGGGAVQPLWITVRVPRDAKPGEYKAMLTVRADQVDPITVPVELRVIDWTLKDSKEYTGYIDVFQSPGSLAIEYKVPMWSEKHWKLIDRSFRLLGAMGLKTLYITCVRRTHLGNEHAMVRWVRGKGGTLTPDLSIAERYLDTAMKHAGKVPGVILYCWEPPTSMGHAGSGPSRTHDRKILITVVDPKTGELSKEQGPPWGTPECRAFWKALSDAMSKALRQRGVEDSMLFGLLGDHRPTKRAMDEITTGLPNRDPGWWALHSHNYCHNWLGHDIGMCVALWGIKAILVEPEKGHGYGWQNAFWLSYYPREMTPSCPLVDYRTKIESRLSSKPWNIGRWPKARGIRGIGRLGAEFWTVLRDKRGRRRGSLAARYPETYWGQLCLNYGVPYILGIGTNGPVATVRSEAFRENMQEIEARVFIEKALVDKALRERLGAGLARRCRAALDDRIRVCLRAAGEGWTWFVSSDWEQRTETLFRLAAEVGAVLGAEHTPARRVRTRTGKEGIR